MVIRFAACVIRFTCCGWSAKESPDLRSEMASQKTTAKLQEKRLPDHGLELPSLGRTLRWKSVYPNRLQALVLESSYAPLPDQVSC
jgi:hypothetical protein